MIYRESHRRAVLLKNAFVYSQYNICLLCPRAVAGVGLVAGRVRVRSRRRRPGGAGAPVRDVPSASQCRCRLPRRGRWPVRGAVVAGLVVGAVRIVLKLKTGT